MRLSTIIIGLLFFQGLYAQPKPYQETLVSIVHTRTYPTGKPFPKHIVRIYGNFSIIYIDENYKRVDHPVKREIIKVVDSTLLPIEKTDFFKLASAYRKLDFDSLYVPKKKSEDSIEVLVVGGAWNKYIIRTSIRTFTIGEGMERDMVYGEALCGFIALIKDVEEKYEPVD